MDKHNKYTKNMIIEMLGKASDYLTTSSNWMEEQNIEINNSTHPVDISGYIDELIEELEAIEDE